MAVTAKPQDNRTGWAEGVLPDSWIWGHQRHSDLTLERKVILACWSVLRLSLGVTLPYLDRSSVPPLIPFWLLPYTEFSLILSSPGLLFLHTVSSIEWAVWPNEAGCTLLCLPPSHCCPLSKVAGQPSFLCLLPALTKSCPFPPSVAVLLSVDRLWPGTVTSSGDFLAVSCLVKDAPS